jgi:hypothetical protein
MSNLIVGYVCATRTIAVRQNCKFAPCVWFISITTTSRVSGSGYLTHALRNIEQNFVLSLFDLFFSFLSFCSVLTASRIKMAKSEKHWKLTQVFSDDDSSDGISSENKARILFFFSFFSRSLLSSPLLQCLFNT